MKRLARCALALIVSSLLSAVPALAADPDPAQCSFGPVIVGSPAYDSGDADDPFLYTVTVRDAGGNPISNLLVAIDFSASTGEVAGGLGPFPAKPYVEQPYHGGVSCSARRVFQVTDSEGRATFRALFGGWESQDVIQVVAGRTTLGYIRARSTDLDGDGMPGLTDFYLFRTAFLCPSTAPPPAAWGDFNLVNLNPPGYDCVTDFGDFNLFRLQYLCPQTMPAPCERPLCP